MFIFRNIPVLGAVLLLSACADTMGPTVTQLSEPEPIRTSNITTLANDADGCHGTDATPAVIETVTEHVMVQPPSVSTDGTVTYPAIYKTETRQKIVEQRREQMFEALCESDFTEQFVASLQRALAARGHYKGPVTGEMTARTRSAIRAYQKPQGLDSAVLSMAAARQLGLIQVERIEDG